MNAIVSSRFCGIDDAPKSYALIALESCATNHYNDKHTNVCLQKNRQHLAYTDHSFMAHHRQVLPPVYTSHTHTTYTSIVD